MVLAIIVGILAFTLDLLALVSLHTSEVSAGVKAKWILLILCIPILGMLIYFITGPGAARRD